MSSFETSDFKKKKAKYYKLLEESGFEDIENGAGELRTHTGESLRKRIAFQTPEHFEARREYFRWAEQMVNLGRFESRTYEMIWNLHAEGRSSREIGRVLGFDQKWVLTLIKRIRTRLLEETPQNAKDE